MKSNAKISQLGATYWIFRPFHIKTNGEGSYSKRDKKKHMKHKQII